jgi:phosphoribosylformimino-5-aminoimidazole carboxamide ribotide isomerase
VATARSFAAAGARWIHVVDLDGAVAGAPVQSTAIAAIASSLPAGVRVELGGGLRTAADVAAALRIAGRVVLGTALLEDPGFGSSLVTAHGSDRIVAALDVRDGRAVGGGWRRGAASMAIGDALAALRRSGIRLAAVTAVARDGTLSGPDLDLLRELVAAGEPGVIASGGIRDLADVLAIRALGCVAAIVGRAVYEGTIDLGDALRRLDAGGPSGPARPA